ncbi:hypothetical protein LOZ80_20835 [Paenibacillus sp. HWE-109]|uniref:hypothetical protein n=1 Tax=Paenibacillus sp. HWE-109 TaxID=1306526 RepID=UPI001EDFB27B|nr:hypothetical protein [Paenibacillus sp. HWE-109]UKS24084.1 hypothetical protein LOZ80_20835 [Paenibacillus sp. HWE-109]
MWSVLGVLIVSLGIFILETKSLWRKQLRKEAWTYSILLFIGVAINITQILHIKLPNPLDAMIFIYKPISDAVFGFLQ